MQNNNQPENDSDIANLTNIVFFLSVHCYIHFLPFSAEIQPIASIPAIYGIIKYSKIFKKHFLSYFSILTMFLIISLVSRLEGQSWDIKYTIETYLAILAPIPIFLFLSEFFNKISYKLLNYIIYAWFIIGLSQTFLPFIQSILLLDKTLPLLISRYSPEMLSAWGRGATLLSPEPSYSARTIFLFFVSIKYTHTKITHKNSIILFLLTLFLCYANQSATIFAILILFVVITYPIALLILSIILPLLASLDQSYRSIRFIEVIHAGWDFIRSFENVTLISFTNAFGSMRTISVFVALDSIANHRFFGTGIGSWSSQFISELMNYGINPNEVAFFSETTQYIVDVKPYGHLAVLLFDMGIWGLLLELIFIFSVLKIITKNTKIKRFDISVVILSLTFIFFNTPVSAPEFWITLAIAINHIINNSNKKSLNNLYQAQLQP